METTKAQFEVCAYTAAGYEAKEIASKTFRSVFTVRTIQQATRIKNNFRNNYEMVMHFVLENGDPRKFIAIAFLVMQMGMIYDDARVRQVKKVARRVKINKTKRSKTRELYV